MNTEDTNSICSSVVDTEQPEGGPVKRKNKSLLALCKKFLDIYPLDMPPGSSLDIPLERLSESLNLSRRRLYDIINIMESLQMAVKVTKNLYRWYGARNVQALLSQLKDMSDREICIELAKLCAPSTEVISMPPPGPLQPPCTPQGDECAQSLLLRSLGMRFLQPAPQTCPQTVVRCYPTTKKRNCSLVDMKESPEPKRPHAWKMKSLGGTCLKFLTLFFKHQTVSLDWAGRVLLCGVEEEKASLQADEDEEEGDSKEQDRQLRNKVRRIYDVANVLCALGLVSKISPRLSSSRKLLYVYSGPPIGTFNPAVQAPASVSIEPPKPGRRFKKPEEQSASRPREPRELRPNLEGLCKRKLDLGTEEESRCLKRVQPNTSLLDESASAFSMLLAVAERELGLASSATPDTGAQPCNSEPLPPREVRHSSSGSSSISSQLHTPFVEIQPKTTKPMCNLPSNQHNGIRKSNFNENSTITSNQENNFNIKSTERKLPIESTNVNQTLQSSRSALRSLLENNRNTPIKSDDFPVIKKFVDTNVENNTTNSVLVNPFGRNLNAPVQTVLIRNLSGSTKVMRRGALSIPWQLNHQAAATATAAPPQFVTRLNMGLSVPATAPCAPATKQHQ